MVRYPASTGQEAIWVAERITPGAGAYVEAFAWRLTPAPDAERLRGALNTLIERHEILRTALVDEGTALAQLVSAPSDAAAEPLTVAAGWTPAELARWLREPIDLASGTPLRAALVQASEGALLGLALHHAVLDSWALELLLDELSRAYAGALEDGAAAQFGPWAEEERRAAAPEVPAELVGLMRAERPERAPVERGERAPGLGSAGAPGGRAAELAPGGRAAELAPGGRAAELAPVAVADAATLRDAARRRRATAFELAACASMRAVRAALRADDAVLGTVVSRRDGADTQRMLGYCAALLPIACGERAELDDVAHGVRLARHVRHVPAPALVAALGRRNGPGRQPLFDALLTYERGAPPAPSLPGIAAVPVPVPATAAKFTLALSLRDDGERLLAGAEWEAGALPDGAARTLLERLPQELEAVCSDERRVQRRRVEAGERAAPAARLRRDENAGAGLRWRDALELEVAAAWQEVLGAPPRAIDEGFFDAGGDSLAAIHLCAGLNRRELGRVEPAQLVEAATVPGIAAAIRASAAAPPDPCLVRLRGGEGRPIVLVHPVGGTVTWYAPLARLLRHPSPIWALQARGLTPGEPFHASLGTMAKDYAALIRDRIGERALAVGGYSMGGTIAAELATRLEERGSAPDVLVLLDTTARPPTRAHDPHYAVRVLVEKALRLRFDWRAIAGEPRERQADAILAAAQDAGRLPRDYDAERLRRMIEVYDHNSAALAAHSPTPYAGRAVLIRTESEESAADPTLGWGELLSDLDVRVAPGDHFSLLDSDNAPAVTELMTAALEAEPVAGAGFGGRG